MRNDLVMYSKNKTILLIFLISILGGATGTFSKIALREVSPVIFTLLRFLFALVVLMPLFLREPKYSVENKKRVIAISLFATINVTFFIFGLRLTTAVISQMLYAAVPLIAGVFSYLINKEEVGVKKALGILIGFVGTLLVIVGPKIGVASVWNGDIVGNILIFIGVVSFSLYSVLSKKYEKEFSPLSLSKYFILTTILVQTVLIAFTSAYNELYLVSDLSLYTWFSILYTGVIGTALWYILYQRVINQTTPVIASMILYLQPLSAILVASILLGEKVTYIFIAGGVLIFSGIALVLNQHSPEVSS